MKINEIRYEATKLVVTIELPLETPEHFSTFHKMDHYAMIGEQLVKAITATRQVPKEQK